MFLLSRKKGGLGDTKIHTYAHTYKHTYIMWTVDN